MWRTIQKSLKKPTTLWTWLRGKLRLILRRRCCFTRGRIIQKLRIWQRSIGICLISRMLHMKSLSSNRSKTRKICKFSWMNRDRNWWSSIRLFRNSRVWYRMLKTGNFQMEFIRITSQENRSQWCQIDSLLNGFSLLWLRNLRQKQVKQIKKKHMI